MVRTCCSRRYCASIPHRSKAERRTEGVGLTQPHCRRSTMGSSPPGGRARLTRLFYYALLESLARCVCQVPAGGSVDQRVRIAMCAPFQSAPEIGGIRVGCQQNVAGKGADGGETLFEVFEHVGIGRIMREEEGIAGHGRQTVYIGDIQAARLLA